MIQTVTRAGIQALARMVSESAELTFTTCSIGSGEFDPDEDDPRDMTALIQQLISVSVTLVRKEDSGVAVVADVDNSSLAAGAIIREMGIYAKLDNGDPFLFLYGYFTTPEIVPPISESTYERRFVSHIAMSDDELEMTVTLQAITPADIGAATADDLDDAEQAIADIATAVGDVDVIEDGDLQTQLAAVRDSVSLVGFVKCEMVSGSHWPISVKLYTSSNAGYSFHFNSENIALARFDANSSTVIKAW